jgi:hypothetical protein
LIQGSVKREFNFKADSTLLPAAQTKVQYYYSGSEEKVLQVWSGTTGGGVDWYLLKDK